MKILISLLLMVLVSCQNLPQDGTPAPIDHNKMTLELQSCNQQEVGLLGCFYNDETKGDLTIPLWSNGEYQIVSDRCDYTLNKKYQGTQKLKLSYNELLKNRPESEGSCLFNIKVFIDKFDNGFEGFFVLTKNEFKLMDFTFEKKSYNGYAGLQLKEGSEPLNLITFKVSQPGVIFWEGCAKDGEKHFESHPSIKIFDVINEPLLTKSSCILTIGMIPDDQSLPVELAKIHINVYEKTIVNLPEPLLSYKKEKLTVTADKLIAGITINDNISIETGNRQKKFVADVKKETEAIVRLLTSNGRFMLLKVKNGEVLWIK